MGCKNQPAELWNTFNTEYPSNVHIRIHPLLSWTEIDIWRYIKRKIYPLLIYILLKMERDIGHLR